MNALRLSAAKYAPDVFDYGILEMAAADQVRSIAKRIRSAQSTPSTSKLGET